MSDKMKIYACSGIGNSTDDAKKPFGYEYWLPEGYSELDNTQAANSLLVKINLCRSQLFNLDGLTDEQKEELINSIIFYSLCLSFVCEYSGNIDQLEKVGNAIGVLVAQGVFADPNITLESGNERIAGLIVSVNDIMDNGSDIAPNEEFLNWWVQDVLAYEKFGLDAEKRNMVRKAIAKSAKSISGTTWKDDNNLSPYLNDASEYFLYAYLTDAQANKLPRIFRTKRKKQQKLYNDCKTLFIRANYGKEEDMKNIIRSGIVGYFKAQPEKVCEMIVANGGRIKGVNGNGIGVLSEAAIVSIIGSVLTFIVGVISAICQMVTESKVAEYKPVNIENAKAAVPSPTDYSGTNGKRIDTEEDSLTPLLLIGGVAAVALFMMD